MLLSFHPKLFILIDHLCYLKLLRNILHDSLISLAFDKIEYLLENKNEKNWQNRMPHTWLTKSMQFYLNILRYEIECIELGTCMDRQINVPIVGNTISSN